MATENDIKGAISVLGEAIDKINSAQYGSDEDKAMTTAFARGCLSLLEIALVDLNRIANAAEVLADAAARGLHR